MRNNESGLLQYLIELPACSKLAETPPPPPSASVPVAVPVATSIPTPTPVATQPAPQQQWKPSDEASSSKLGIAPPATRAPDPPASASSGRQPVAPGTSLSSRPPGQQQQPVDSAAVSSPALRRRGTAVVPPNLLAGALPVPTSDEIAKARAGLLGKSPHKSSIAGQQLQLELSESPGVPLRCEPSSPPPSGVSIESISSFNASTAVATAQVPGSPPNTSMTAPEQQKQAALAAAAASIASARSTAAGSRAPPPIDVGGTGAQQKPPPRSARPVPPQNAAPTQPPPLPKTDPPDAASAAHSKYSHTAV